MTDATPLASEQITQGPETDGTAPGEVGLHCSDDDGVPDVGVSIGLGAGKQLWIGEALVRDCATIALVFHGPGCQRIAAPLWPDCEWQEAGDILRHHVAPAIAALSATPAPSDQDASQAQGEVERARAFLGTFGLGFPMSNDERQMIAQIMAQFAALSPAPGATAQDGVERVEWRCFHCGDTFTDERCARLHFGRDEDSDPACVIKAGAEQGLLGALREAEYAAADARRAIADESTEAAQAYYAQATRHAQALRNAEEAGYEKGLADGRALDPTPTIPAGMVAHDGKGKPADWDGGPVLHRRHGIVDFPTDTEWRLGRIIAYTPLAAAPKQAEQQGVGEWRPIEVEALRKGLRRSPKYYPAIGETCRMSAPNCDNENGYTWADVEVLWRDDLFIVTRAPGCWPDVTKLELALFEPAALNAPTGAVEKERGA